MAFRASSSKGTKVTARQCYFCSNYFVKKYKFDFHFEHCTGQPGYVYNVNIQNLLTFEKNLKYKGNVSLVACIDFETTAQSEECLDPENRKLFAASYVIVFAFHPELDINRVII